MLISVVMPSFNQGGFIEQSIRSVLEQGYSPMELVIADGGSTDGTLQILQKLKSEFGGKLRWKSEKDNGPANAINKAVRRAKGGIIGWLNSDDLYESGSIKRAVKFFSTSPDMVMVYGEGKHIDERGNVLGAYPTKTPSKSLSAFQQGCYICQPAVFLRKEVFDKVGLLDESIATAFDFELWLRVFKKYPTRIAHINDIQAHSRLHNTCITQTQRELVALDGMKVLARHIGSAHPHWLLTYFEELCEKYPFGESPENLQNHLLELIEKAKPYLDTKGIAELNDKLGSDARWEITLPNVYADIYPDGWASSVLEIRVRCLERTVRRVTLFCEHSNPISATLALEVSTLWVSDKQQVVVDTAGEFIVSFLIPKFDSSQEVTVNISCRDTFVPKHVEDNSSDTRELAFRVNKIAIV